MATAADMLRHVRAIRPDLIEGFPIGGHTTEPLPDGFLVTAKDHGSVTIRGSRRHRNVLVVRCPGHPSDEWYTNRYDWVEHRTCPGNNYSDIPHPSGWLLDDQSWELFLEIVGWHRGIVKALLSD